MRIKINDKVQSNDTPLIVMSKYLIDTENKLKYDLQEYSNSFSSDYNVLLVDNTSNVVKGIIRIDRLAAPQEAFISLQIGNYLNLQDTIQLAITHIDIPQKWIGKKILNEIFSCIQYDIRTYFSNKRVIIWLSHQEYKMCPVATDFNDKEYKYFAPKMAEIFYDILRKY